MPESSPRRRRDPAFKAAVLKLTFNRRKDEQSPQFEAIYKGVLRDLKLTDEEVETYLQSHMPEVEAAIARQGHDVGEDE